MLRYEDDTLYKDLQHHANKKGYFVVIKPECFLLYRNAEPKNVLVGSRKRLKSIEYLLNKITKVF